jgi:hypothetical protein
MDRWLKENLDGIPYFIEKKYDVVGIVSGTGKVRLGKSTLAIQCAYYIAWILAGGRVILNETGTTMEVIPPTKPVNFSLSNLVFAPEDLKKKAHELPPNSVIVYDEGRAGLDASRSMESVNKGMQDFFQECGVYGHVILIVLPDFFQLHRSYAVNRSLFLLNVFADSKHNRGYFSFFNDQQKELLYHWGRKKVGANFQYSSAKRNFWGRFSDWLPFDKDEYEALKKKALDAKRLGAKPLRDLKARDLLIHYIIFRAGIEKKDLVHDLDELGYNVEGAAITGDVIDRSLRNVVRMWTGAQYVLPEQEDTGSIEDLDRYVEEELKKMQATYDGPKNMPNLELIDSKPKEWWDQKLKSLFDENDHLHTRNKVDELMIQPTLIQKEDHNGTTNGTEGTENI